VSTRQLGVTGGTGKTAYLTVREIFPMARPINAVRTRTRRVEAAA
jgi:hypothetical protein